MKLLLASTFQTQTLAEQIELAKVIREGDEGLGSIKGSAWSQSVASTVRAGSLENVAAYFVDYETAYKEATGDKKMPSWYRSNKSVINTALKNGVELLAVDGMPRGKTEVEKDCKVEAEPKTPIQRILKAFDTIGTNIDHDDFEESDKATVAKLIRDLTAKLESL